MEISYLEPTVLCSGTFAIRALFMTYERAFCKVQERALSTWTLSSVRSTRIHIPIIPY